MLLRVDIARGGPSGPVLGDDGPLHACLSTAPVPSAARTRHQGGGAGGDAPSSTQASGGSGGASSASGDGRPGSGGAGGAGAEQLRTGEILTVGRKSSLVVLPDDRAVSRSHASIRLISSDAPGEGERPATLLGDDLVMEHGRPETEWERAACASSPSGTVCVVRDNGSKFGTFVGADPAMLERYLPAPAGDGRGERDGDATDDETDDEGAAAAGPGDRFALRGPEGHQSAALGVLHPAGDAPTRFVALRKGGLATMPLLQLSHSDPGGPPPSVVLLFGTMGSAVRLTLVPMNYVFSSIRKADLAPVVASLGYVGATHSDRWDPSRSTHLVTSEKKAAAKGIMAWCCRRPAVTKGYVAALVGRRDARDPLPDPADHVPPGKDWDRDLVPSSGPCRSLLGYRVACMVDDDSEALSSSAGAEVLRLHDGEVLPASVRDDAEEARFWYDRQMARAEEDRRVLVLIESSSKSCKALFGTLKGVDGIRITNARNLAKAITSNRGAGDLILDTKRVPIQKIVGWDAEPGTAADEADGASGDGVGAAAGGTGAGAVAEEDKAEVEDDEGEEEESAPAKRKRGAGDDEPGADDGRADGPDEEAPEPAEKRQRTRKPAEEIPEEPEGGMDFGDGGGDGGRPEEDEEDEEKEEPPKEPEVESSDEDEPGVPAERRELEVTDDGWMVAAPPRHRRAYRREIEQTESVASEVAADTERVGTLVVREYVPPAARARRAARSGRDFKRFRKNVIIPGYTTSGDQKDSYRDCSDGVVQIVLEDSFAKDSERLRQLQMQQEELEREQAAAESLFNDDGRGGAKTGRKKKRGAGITAYMTQSTVKRGRGRRG